MSKNLSDIGASPLNLSLTGLQLNQNKNSNSSRQQNNVKKPPAYSQRSYLSSSSTNLSINSNTNKKPPNNDNKANLKLDSSRSNSNYNVIDKSKIKLPGYLKKDEKELNKNEEKVKESNVFTPLSVRSSTDEFDLINRKNDFKKTNASGLDLFFNSNSISRNNSENVQYSPKDAKNGNERALISDRFAGSENEFKVINPLKEDNLNKLKTSVETLRRELKLETIANENNDFMNQRLKEIRKKQAARKILKWYRKIKNKRLNNQSEIENEKKNEMRKKMETSFEKSSIFNNKKPTKITNQSVKIDKTKNEISKSIKPNTESIKTSMLINEKLNDQSITLKESMSSSIKTDSQLLLNGSNNNSQTVESLLLSLDKIDKDSENLLKFDKRISHEKDISGASVTSEKINSIMSFLDEAATKETDSFTPKPLKDFKFDMSFFNDFKDEKINSPPVTPKKTANKKVIEKKEIINEKPIPRPNSAKKPPIEKSESLSKLNQKHTVKSDDDEDRQFESSSSKFTSELTNKVLTLEMEIEEKKRTISMLEKALSQQRELTIRHTQEADKEAQILLEAQKNDYETTIQRHLGFIDQLIDDKKNLSEKCEKLVKELKDAEKSYTDRIRTAEEKYKIETTKTKEMYEAAEKIRREKWIDEKAKKIKEMTIKGMEPEIQALINKHKNEIKTLKTIHETELLQADERAAQRYIKVTEELRENFEREKEASVQREKDICKQRYEKSLEEEEKSFLEQRRRLYAEVEEEKNRVAEQAAFQRKELDRLRRVLEENNLNTIESIKKEYLNAQSELEKKHQTEIQNLKEKLDIEKQSWEQNYIKKQENWVLQKERELKEQVKRERDKEIELLITRLEAESTSSREESERAAENRIKRIRDKYESELKEVEKTERETMERYNSVKAKYNELEGEHERLKVLYKQKEKDMEGIKKLTDTLQDERNRLADIIRQEFSDRLIFTEEENKRIKMEMAELKSRHQYELDKRKQEIEKLQQEKADELNTLSEKIKEVVAKKDDAINKVKKEYEAACKRADHLEGLLEQQRTLLMKKQNNQ